MDERLRIVVADPDPNYQRRIISRLRSDFICIPTDTLVETWQVICQEVRRAYQNQKWPPLLTLELSQPDGDGVEFIRYLQADPYLRYVLIACVTQQSSLRDKVKAFRAGADDYIVKPHLPEHFASMMLFLHQQGYLARRARTAGGVL